MSEEVVELIRRADRAVVEAHLYHGMKPQDLLVVEREWGLVRSLVMQQLLRCGVERQQWPQSLHWDWSRKAPELKLLESTGFGIVCEKRWQGVMLTKTASHTSQLAGDEGKPLVYVDYLEVAPWNWNISSLDQKSEFRGVGSLLFRRAVTQSVKEGFYGRIGLHALPQAERFYEECCGMTSLGPDANKQDLLYCEFSPEQAEKFLDDGGAR